MERKIRSMQATAVTAPDQKHGLRRAFVASLAGTSLEWYDFAVYGVAAAP
jgi:hypothetical protein